MSLNIGLREGICRREHYDAMGDAIWLFMWIIKSQTAESENGTGAVFNGTPITYDRIEQETRFPRRTIQRWMSILEEHGYITLSRHRYGLSVTVNKAKKFSHSRRAKSGASDAEKTQIQDTPKVAHLEESRDATSGASEDSRCATFCSEMRHNLYPDAPEVAHHTTKGVEREGKKKERESRADDFSERFIAHCRDGFITRHGSEPSPSDRSWNHLAIAMVDTKLREFPIAELIRRWDNFMASTDQWHADKAGDLAWFLNHTNDYINPRHKTATGGKLNGSALTEHNRTVLERVGRSILERSVQTGGDVQPADGRTTDGNLPRRLV